MGIIYIIGIVQAFFIEFILLNKKRKSLSDKILAVWMFFIGFLLFFYYLYFKEYYYEYPHTLGVALPLPLIHGPFLLLYVTSLIDRHQHFNKINLIHFIPALSYYVMMIPKFALSGPDKLAYVFKELPVSAPIYVDVYSYLFDISGVVYVTWSLILLRKHQKTIGENFSYTEKINLNWLRNIIVGMAIIWITVIMANFLQDDIGDNLIYLTVVLFVFLVGYYGSRQGIIFTDQFDYPDPPPIEVVPKSKYQKSGLTKEMIQDYLTRLNEYMANEKPYLESKMTLPDLAFRLDLNPNYLSQVINDQLGQNFYDFINKYRVEEFKHRLQNPRAKNYTFLGHALESGFSSKSSFNEVFKKLTGQTPSEYQRSTSP